MSRRVVLFCSPGPIIASRSFNLADKRRYGAGQLASPIADLKTPGGGSDRDRKSYLVSSSTSVNDGGQSVMHPQKSARHTAATWYEESLIAKEGVMAVWKSSSRGSVHALQRPSTLAPFLIETRSPQFWKYIQCTGTSLHTTGTLHTHRASHPDYIQFASFFFSGKILYISVTIRNFKAFGSGVQKLH